MWTQLIYKACSSPKQRMIVYMCIMQQDFLEFPSHGNNFFIILFSMALLLSI